MKKEATLLAITSHEEICTKVHRRFEEMLTEKMTALEKNIGLLIENKILTAIKDEGCRTRRSKK